MTKSLVVQLWDVMENLPFTELGLFSASIPVEEIDEIFRVFFLHWEDFCLLSQYGWGIPNGDVSNYLYAFFSILFIFSFLEVYSF